MDATTFFEAILNIPLPDMRGLTVPKQESFWPDSPTSKLCQFISEVLPENAVVVADASVARDWAGAAIRFNKNGQRLISPAGSGSLSFALPAAIGAALARPDSVVIGFGGDGGFSMALHYMETAVRLGVPIVYFLLNNNRLGLIDNHSTKLLGGEPVSAEFVAINWKAIAAGFQWDYLQANKVEQLRDNLPNLEKITKPLLVEYCIPTDEMGPDFYLTLMRKQKFQKEIKPTEPQI